MTRRYLNTLKDGDLVEEVYRVADRQLRANRNAALYLSLDLRDKTGVMNARMWNITEEMVTGIQSGGYVRVRGKVQLFQGSLQMILSRAEAVSAEGLVVEEFETAHCDASELLERLAGYLLTIEHPHLRPLVEAILADEPLMAQLGQVPAGVKAHHAYLGGLLEHLVTLLELTRKVCEVYPDLDRDLMYVGVLLHDIGKTRELSCDAGFAYTDQGQLLGHLVIGVEMLTEKIRQITAAGTPPFPTELEWRLKHMILSHHGTYEFGSPRLPMTPEALALHLIDTLDSKLHEFTRTIQEDANSGSHWTLFSARLDRKLFKGAPIED